MKQIDRSGVISLAEGLDLIADADGNRAAVMLVRGTLDVKLVLPVAPNEQTPHRQDEIYFVIRGEGTLVHEGEDSRFQEGDLLFVAAGTEHHYESFSEDLALWRVFYGPAGGEIRDFPRDQDRGDRDE